MAFLRLTAITLAEDLATLAAALLALAGRVILTLELLVLAFKLSSWSLVDFMAIVTNFSIVSPSSFISGESWLDLILSAKTFSEEICSETWAGSVATRIEAIASEAAWAIASTDVLAEVSSVATAGASVTSVLTGVFSTGMA